MTGLTTDREAFIRAIIAAPKDDAPRLVFADWLDENGEPQLAEFIRKGIEFHDCHVSLDSVGLAIGNVILALGFDAKGLGFKLPDGLIGVIRRGFIDEVHCKLGDWMKHGPAIASDQPVTKLDIADVVVNMHISTRLTQTDRNELQEDEMQEHRAVMVVDREHLRHLTAVRLLASNEGKCTPQASNVMPIDRGRSRYTLDLSGLFRKDYTIKDHIGWCFLEWAKSAS